MTIIFIVCGILVASSSAVASLLFRFNQKLQKGREALAQNQERLSRILRSSGIVVWSWIIAPNSVEADENCSVLFGLPLGQFPQTAEGFAALVHPDDRERVQQAVAASVERGAPYNTDYRVVWPDDTIRSLTVRAKVYDDQSGRPYRLTGICWDADIGFIGLRRYKCAKGRMGVGPQGDETGQWAQDLNTDHGADTAV